MCPEHGKHREQVTVAGLPRHVYLCDSHGRIALDDPEALELRDDA